MTVQLFTPPGLATGTPYHHVAVATGTRHVHVAGQVGGHLDGTPLAPDLAGQVVQALHNTAVALRGAGATLSDVVRLTLYVTRWTEDQMPQLLDGLERAASELDLPLPLPPASLIGVETLYAPDVLVEIEATAITD